MDDRNPRRGSRRAYLSLLAILLAAAVAYFTLPIEIVAPLAPIALVGVILSLALGSILGDMAKKRARMERGDGVIAKWTLDAGLSHAMVRLNEGMVNLPSANAAEPRLDVVFAEDAVYVSGEYYTMDRSWGTHAAMHPSPSGEVYIQLSQGGLETYTPIRIPVPPGKHGEATRVVRYFNDPKGR